jgi:hypothetical protein
MRARMMMQRARKGESCNSISNSERLGLRDIHECKAFGFIAVRAKSRQNDITSAWPIDRDQGCFELKYGCHCETKPCDATARQILSHICSQRIRYICFGAALWGRLSLHSATHKCCV